MHISRALLCVRPEVILSYKPEWQAFLHGILFYFTILQNKVRRGFMDYVVVDLSFSLNQSHWPNENKMFLLEKSGMNYNAPLKL